MDKLSQKYITYLKIERNASKHTIESYENDLNAFRDFLSRTQPGAITNQAKVTRFTIRAWMGELSENGFSKSSIARKLSALRSFYKYCCRRGYLDENPATLVATPKKDKRLPHALQTSVIDSMFDAMPAETVIDKRNRAIVELLYATGMRLSELTSLNLSSVDFSAQRIRVMGKGAKERIIPFGSKAVDAMNSWLEVRSELLSAKPTADDSGAFFLSNSGRRIYPVAVQRIVKQTIQKVSESSKTNPHILRHSFATHLLNNGADIRIIKELMGHSALTSTQIYTSTSVERLKDIYKNSHPRGKT